MTAPTADGATDGGATGAGHPVGGRQRLLGDLADTVRSLVQLTVTSGAPAEVLDEVVADLRRSAERLAEHVPESPPSRYFRQRAADPADGRQMHDAMPFDLVIGRYNPLAPPVEIELAPPLAVGRVRFSPAYEGAPGWVHGAAIAAAFDIVLTAANRLQDAAGPTVRLAVRYRRPTLLATEARFEGWIVERRGRRVVSAWRLVQDGEITVEAEGEFAAVAPDFLGPDAVVGG